MGRHRAVESGIQQKRSQGVPYGDRYGTHYSISRSRSSQISSSWLQAIRPAALANRCAQVSRSVVRYPSRWLGATWVVFMVVGSVATITLLKIDPVQPESIAASPGETATSTPLLEQSQAEPPQAEAPAAQSVPARSQPAQSKPKDSLPLFALGSVALSCAIGCLMLSYRFSTRPAKPQSRLPLRPTRLPRPPAATQRQSTVRTTRATKAATSSDPSTASVTIVSSDQSHPLDWDEPSLADNLDIRQQRPLSHWL